MRSFRQRLGSHARRLVALGLAGPLLAPAEPTAAPPTLDLRVSTPVTHRNLTLYLLHGDDAYATDAVLTLDEALQAQKVIVHETGNVSQLAVENLSETETVLLQAGDIVKGGQQDRALSTDLILPPKSGKVPIASFCVESGRWSGRTGERVDRFASSKHMLSSKALKLAARDVASQGAVWEQVSNLQDRLEERVGDEVKSERSKTSLPLSLEHEAVRGGIEAYLAVLEGLAEKHADTRGFVAVVDGEISSAEVYASHDLYVRLWPPLARALATEALALAKDDVVATPPSADDVGAFLREAEAGRVEASPAPGNEKRATDSTLYFEAGTPELPKAHRSYIKK